MSLDDAYSLVMEVADRFSVRADNHEELFDSILQEYDGPSAGLASWLAQRIPQAFPAIAKRPVWIQEEEWPVDDHGTPLVFMGQIDVPAGTSRFFHDDVSLFVFFDPAGEPEVVMQQA